MIDEVGASDGKLFEHNAKNPLGTGYLKSPCPFASLYQPSEVAPAKVLSCPKLAVNS